MLPELVDLPISAREIEHHSNLEVSELFVGSVLVGIYRPSIFRHVQKSLAFAGIELALMALIGIFCLPIGFVFQRQSASPQLFVGIVGTAMTGVVLLRHLYRFKAGQALQPLMVLLDEVDQFNQMVQALVMLERLENLRAGRAALANRAEIMAVLELTRENLMVGLATEKILRDNRDLLSRRQELLTHIEQNLATLGSMASSSPADEYRRVLQESLQIGLRVKQEMLKLNLTKTPSP